MNDLRLAVRALRATPIVTTVVITVPRPGHRREHGDLLAGERPAPPRAAGPGRRSSGHSHRRQHGTAVHIRRVRRAPTSRPPVRRRAGLGRVRPDDRRGGGARVRAMGQRRLLRHAGGAGIRRPHVDPGRRRGGRRPGRAGRSHQPWPLATPFRWNVGRDRPLAPGRGCGGHLCRRGPARIPWRAGGVGVRPAPARSDQRHDATVRTPSTPPAEQSEVRHRLARAVASIPGVAAADDGVLSGRVAPSRWL